MMVVVLLMVSAVAVVVVMVTVVVKLFVLVRLNNKKRYGHILFTSITDSKAMMSGW
jgi:hypothetical protein